MTLPRVRRVRKPEFPQFGSGANAFVSILQFIVGVFIWILLILFFLLSLYSQWFGVQLTYLLTLIKPKAYYVPFWFSFVCSLLFFPVTLVIGLGGTLIKIIKE